jgi:hypothetical protein
LDPVTTAFSHASVEKKKKKANILHQTMVYAASFRTELDLLG